MYVVYNMAIQSFIGLFERTIDRTFRFIENNDISFFINDTQGKFPSEISMRFAVRPHAYFDQPKIQNTRRNFLDVD